MGRRKFGKNLLLFQREREREREEMTGELRKKDVTSGKQNLQEELYIFVLVFNWRWSLVAQAIHSFL